MLGSPGYLPNYTRTWADKHTNIPTARCSRAGAEPRGSNNKVSRRNWKPEGRQLGRRMTGDAGEGSQEVVRLLEERLCREKNKKGPRKVYCLLGKCSEGCEQK